MPVWFPPGAGPGWLAAWHGFGWLADLISVGAAARDPARALVQSWLADNAAWHPVAWRSDVAATRIFAWIVHFDEIAGREVDRALRRAMLASIAAQVRHLARDRRLGAGRRGPAARAERADRRACRARRLGKADHRGRCARSNASCRSQILPDGGHRTRNPSVQLAGVARPDRYPRGLARRAGSRSRRRCQQAIERMAPMLRFFRHGDRRLALFNGSVEEDGVIVDLALTRSETRGHAPTQAPHAGFQRLQAGQSLVLVDTGKPPPRGFDEAAHAGTLSFELSQGRERIIVNCGGYRGVEAGLAAGGARQRGAFGAGRRRHQLDRDPAPTARSAAARHSVRCERAEEGGHQWIAASHDGYRARFGVTYARELYLAADGDDLRGEDKADRARRASPSRCAFTCIPSVEASLAADGSGALLRLPGGAVWRLRAAGAEMSLGESIYLGAGELREDAAGRAERHHRADGATVRWALRREPAPLRRPLLEPIRRRQPASDARTAAAEQAPRRSAAENGAAAPELDGKRQPAEDADGATGRSHRGRRPSLGVGPRDAPGLLPRAVVFVVLALAGAVPQAFGQRRAGGVALGVRVERRLVAPQFEQRELVRVERALENLELLAARLLSCIPRSAPSSPAPVRRPCRARR